MSKSVRGGFVLQLTKCRGIFNRIEMRQARRQGKESTSKIHALSNFEFRVTGVMTSRGASAVGDEWLIILRFDGGGDEGVEFYESGPPDDIEKAGGFFGRGFVERDDATRKCHTDDGESFEAYGTTLEFPPCHAGNGGWGDECVRRRAASRS
jgi:hypothetical protein